MGAGRKCSLQQRTTFAGGNTQTQGVELDKAVGIAMIVGTGIVFKGGYSSVEQGVVGLAANYHDVALVQFQADYAINALLGSINHLLQHVALGAPPVAVVDHGGVLGHQLVFQVRYFTVQGDGLDGTVCLEHDGAAGGFVAAAGFHADVAVFYDVDTANTVVATHLVQVGQHLRRGHVLTVDGYDVAFTVGQFQIGRGVRGFL